MKKLQNLALLLISALFIFTSCGKEDLNVQSEAINSDDLTIGFQNDRLAKTQNALELQIVASTCTIQGISLRVFEETSNKTLSELNMDLHEIQWYQEEGGIISNADFTTCLDEGFYQVIVTNILSGIVEAESFIISFDRGQEK